MADRPYGAVVIFHWPSQYMRGGLWRPKLAVLLVRLAAWITHGRIVRVEGCTQEERGA